MELIIIILIGAVVTPIIAYQAGYNNGKVAGAKFVQDVHSGKYDEQIMQEELEKLGAKRLK